MVVARRSQSLRQGVHLPASQGQRKGIPFFDPNRPFVMLCIYNRSAVFDWDENNLRKIRVHRIKSEEVEQGLSNSPILIYEQDARECPVDRRK